MGGLIRLLLLVLLILLVVLVLRMLFLLRRSMPPGRRDGRDNVLKSSDDGA